MKRGKRRGRRETPEQKLHPAWVSWIAENLIAGAKAGQIAAELRASEPSLSDADGLVQSVAESALLPALREVLRKLARRTDVLALLGAHARAAEVTIARRATPTAEEFFRGYYATNTPAVFVDFTAEWKARSWSPAYLREHLGAETMEIASGRAKSEKPDRVLDAHREMTTVAAYVDRVLAAGATNDLYTVANNKNMDREAFTRLLQDVEFRADYFNPGHLTGGTSFWFGPAGTTTSFHHDSTNILFHQLYGRKRFVLAAPYEPLLLDCAEGFYSSLDPDLPSFPAEVRTHEVVLEPGETLFLPAGWWHKVTALDVSISFSQLNLKIKNSFEDYKPGHR
jgi:Cupin-like domain